MQNVVVQRHISTIATTNIGQQTFVAIQQIQVFFFKKTAATTTTN